MSREKRKNGSHSAEGRGRKVRGIENRKEKIEESVLTLQKSREFEEQVKTNPQL